jgi:hypothetical protein
MQIIVSVVLKRSLLRLLKALKVTSARISSVVTLPSPLKNLTIAAPVVKMKQRKKIGPYLGYLPPKLTDRLIK